MGEPWYNRQYILFDEIKQFGQYSFTCQVTLFIGKFSSAGGNWTLKNKIFWKYNLQLCFYINEG